MKSYLFFVLICVSYFIVFSDGLYLKINPVTKSLDVIDVKTYFLPSTPRTRFCVWPRMNTNENGFSCDQEIDAHYSVSTSLYNVQDWFRSEHDFGENGGILLEFHVIDLNQFVQYGFEKNVWSLPTDCSNVWDKISSEILKPMIGKLGSISHKEIGVVIEEHGLSFEMRCKTRNDVIRQRQCQDNNNINCEASEIIGYRLCTPETFLQILEANPQQNNFKLI